MTSLKKELAQKARQRLRPIARHVDGQVVNDVDDVSLDPNAWPTPQPLPDDLPSVLPFDFDLLPTTLRPWIEDISDRLQCPPDFPAVAAMVALSGIVGRKVGIRPKRKDNWLVVPNLWGAVIGRPSLMKTPAIQEPLKPIGDERQKGGQCEGRMSVEKGATVEQRSAPRGLVRSTRLLGGSKDVDGGAVRSDSAEGVG